MQLEGPIVTGCFHETLRGTKSQTNKTENWYHRPQWAHEGASTTVNFHVFGHEGSLIEAQLLSRLSMPPMSISAVPPVKQWVLTMFRGQSSSSLLADNKVLGTTLKREVY